jgi:hypothetical protein
MKYDSESPEHRARRLITKLSGEDGKVMQRQAESLLERVAYPGRDVNRQRQAERSLSKQPPTRFDQKLREAEAKRDEQTKVPKERRYEHQTVAKKAPVRETNLDKRQSDKDRNDC